MQKETEKLQLRKEQRGARGEAGAGQFDEVWPEVFFIAYHYITLHGIARRSHLRGWAGWAGWARSCFEMEQCFPMLLPFVIRSIPVHARYRRGNL